MNARRLRLRIVESFWLAAAWLASRRRTRATAAQSQRHVFRDQTRRMGLRFDEPLRDTMRTRWLRVVRPSRDDE